MTANLTSNRSEPLTTQRPAVHGEASPVSLKLHTPGPIPPIDDDDDDEDNGKGSGGGGSIDPDEDDDKPDDDEDDQETLWAGGAVNGSMV